MLLQLGGKQYLDLVFHLLQEFLPLVMFMFHQNRLSYDDDQFCFCMFIIHSVISYCMRILISLNHLKILVIMSLVGSPIYGNTNIV